MKKWLAAVLTFVLPCAAWTVFAALVLPSARQEVILFLSILVGAPIGMAARVVWLVIADRERGR